MENKYESIESGKICFVKNGPIKLEYVIRYDNSNAKYKDSIKHSLVKEINLYPAFYDDLRKQFFLQFVEIIYKDGPIAVIYPNSCPRVEIKPIDNDIK